jgi:endothelin-converting enzyme/putative endopeptidase
MTSNKDLARVLATLHRQGVGGLFEWGVIPNLHNSSRNVSWFDQGGMALGNKDFYTASDEKSATRRTRYVEHIAAMFVLLGIPASEAKVQAEQVMAIEMKLAHAAMTPTERRDISKLDHWMSRKNFAALTPSFAWEEYFVAAPKFSELNATSPDYFKALDAAISSVDVAQWKSYLTWHFIHTQAESLPNAFGEENFNFYGKELSGATQRQPRWKRCMRAVDADLGEALGKFYVDVAFAGNAKTRALTMVHDIEKAMEKVIKEMPWLDKATKKKALVKLQLLANKIGYPERWRNYSALRIVRGDQLGNSLRANAFEINRMRSKISKAVDKKEWGMTPPTVNAYYNPLENNINFPAGILQPPFFDKDIDDAVNYGAIGVVIGHELTHGFDDKGSAFDGKGNLQDWWTANDKFEFKTYGACFVEQYAAYSPVDGAKLNGELTQGENIADNGGAHLAYLALRERLKGNEPAAVDGFSADQRFWIGFAQVWCENVRPEQARTLVLSDSHAPGRFRTNGVASNSPDFARAFSCKVGDPMVRGEKACKLW